MEYLYIKTPNGVIFASFESQEESDKLTAFVNEMGWKISKDTIPVGIHNAMFKKLNAHTHYNLKDFLFSDTWVEIEYDFCGKRFKCVLTGAFIKHATDDTERLAIGKHGLGLWPRCEIVYQARELNKEEATKLLNKVIDSFGADQIIKDYKAKYGD